MQSRHVAIHRAVLFHSVLLWFHGDSSTPRWKISGSLLARDDASQTRPMSFIRSCIACSQLNEVYISFRLQIEIPTSKCCYEIETSIFRLLYVIRAIRDVVGPSLLRRLEGEE